MELLGDVFAFGELHYCKFMSWIERM